ncbi:hypothetical protein Tco_0233130 [Tanacetum coccineum]
MVDHSQKWHDGSSSRNIDSSINSEGITGIIRPHLDMECPINEEVKSMEEVKYGEFGRPFLNNSRNDGRLNRGIAGYGSHDHPHHLALTYSTDILINIGRSGLRDMRA